jgi:hypothetical protein
LHSLKERYSATPPAGRRVHNHSDRCTYLADGIGTMHQETPYTNIFELLGDFPERRQRNIYKIAEGLDIVAKEIVKFDLADRVKLIRRLNEYLLQFS